LKRIRKGVTRYVQKPRIFADIQCHLPERDEFVQPTGRYTSPSGTTLPAISKPHEFNAGMI